MPLKLNDRVWILTERLYLHSHKVEGFLQLLKDFEIEYPGNSYQNFAQYKNLYIFMSEENYDFAIFMREVPSEKYLPLLGKVLFDPKIINTQKDDWNYYNEYVKNWYPDLLGLLDLAGVIVDPGLKKLAYREREESIVNPNDNFIPDAFGDMFLDNIRAELNSCYRNGFYSSAMFLSRKLLESSVIRILETVFPKLENSQYNESNHVIWYSKNNSQYHSLSTLLKNLEANASKFDEDQRLIIELVMVARPLKNETNVCIHSDYKVPDEAYIQQWKIPYLMGLTRKVFRKYCES
jgi:hypothetical protein